MAPRKRHPAIKGATGKRVPYVRHSNRYSSRNYLWLRKEKSLARPEPAQEPEPHPLLKIRWPLIPIVAALLLWAVTFILLAERTEEGLGRNFARDISSWVGLAMFVGGVISYINYRWLDKDAGG
jgi:hypothetical protein